MSTPPREWSSGDFKFAPNGWYFYEVTTTAGIRNTYWSQQQKHKSELSGSGRYFGPLPDVDCADCGAPMHQPREHHSLCEYGAD